MRERGNRGEKEVRREGRGEGEGEGEGGGEGERERERGGERDRGGEGERVWTEHPHTRFLLEHFRPCGHITLWLKVSHTRVCMKHVHPHVITCLSVCCFLGLSSSSVSRASTFSLTSTCGTSTPIMSRTQSIQPKAHPQNEVYCPVTIHNLSQVMSPTSSTTQRLLQRSLDPSTQTLNCRTRAMRNSTMSLLEKRNLHHCSFRSEKNQQT